MDKKTKGNLAELEVAADLVERGWRVLFPFGENNRYDLVAEKEGRFVRIQVKYVTPKNGALIVNCRSSNNWSVQSYDPSQIDAIAAYNATDRKVYYIPAEDINKSVANIRLEPSRNKQKKGIRWAQDYVNL